MTRQLKYNQAKFEIMNLIAAHHLKQGDKLPSIHEMNDLFDFSEISLRRALNDLEAKGYLEKRKGVGIYLAAALEIWDLNSEILFIDISANETPTGPCTYNLKRYLRQRCVSLNVISGFHPDGEILHAAEKCIGVIVSGWVTEEWVRFLSALPLPVLYVGSYEATKNLPSLSYDWREAVRILLRRFQSRGLHRIGLINGDRCYYPSHLICSEYLSEGVRLGMDVSEDYVLWKEFGNAEPLFDFLKQQGDFDALIVENGALMQLLLTGRQYSLAEKTAFGVLGAVDNNVSSDNIIFISFGNNIMEEAGKVFFDSMNDPDYFRAGPRLLSPHIL